MYHRVPVLAVQHLIIPTDSTNTGMHSRSGCTCTDQYDEWIEIGTCLHYCERQANYKILFLPLFLFMMIYLTWDPCMITLLLIKSSSA